MATYYKFDLRYVDSISNFSFKKNIGWESDNRIKLYSIGGKLSSKDRERLQGYLKKFSLSFSKLSDEDIKELDVLINSIDKKEPFTFSNNITNTIIGEIVYDQDNNRYIKELLSNLVFPIPTEKNIDLSYEIVKSYEVVLQINRSFSISSLLKIRVVALNERYATQNEIDEYLNKYNQKSFKGKRKKEYYLKELKKLFNENVYKEGISFVDRSSLEKDKEYQTQNKETIIMENIEYLLQELLIKNKDLYIKYQNEYQQILNNQEGLTITPITISNLVNLESKIEFELSYNKKDASNIVDYLNNLKDESLKSFLDNNQIKVSLSYDEIDKITELFLKQKDEYNIVRQREVLKDLAFLYLFKIKEEIEVIDNFKLENSYFKFLLKSVILWIRILESENIIKDNIVLDLTSNLNSSTVLDIIRKIEFNYVNDKELIKKINM